MDGDLKRNLSMDQIEGNAIPKWLKIYLNREQIDRISKTVEKCEKETSAEIVPMIVQKSAMTGGVYNQILIFCVSILTFSEAYFLFSDNWATVISLFLIGLIISHFVARSLAKISFIQRTLISREELRNQVHQRALLEFYLLEMVKTRGRTGVLIFVSLLERQIVVIADEAINAKMGSQFWNDVCSEFVHYVKNKQMEKGFTLAIQKISTQLTEKFPHQSDDINEIANCLVIKD